MSTLRGFGLQAVKDQQAVRPSQSVRAQGFALSSRLRGNRAEDCDLARPLEKECLEGLGRGLSQVAR